MMKRILFLIVGLLFCGNVFSFTMLDLPIHGFWEFDYGGKIKNDKTKHSNYNLLEERLQVKTRYYPREFLSQWNPEVFFRGDFVVDEYYGGKTDFQLREFYTQFSPVSFMDIKLGRQIFTWGTGDFLLLMMFSPKTMFRSLRGVMMNI